MFPFSLSLYRSSFLSYTLGFVFVPEFPNGKDGAQFSVEQVQERGTLRWGLVLSHFYFLTLGAYHVYFQNRRARVLWDMVVRGSGPSYADGLCSPTLC